MPTFHYLIVLNDGAPLIMMRTPMVLRARRRGGPRYVHELRWKQVVNGALELLKKHGLRRKNLVALDNSSRPEEWCAEVGYPFRSEPERAEAEAFVGKLGRAFDGDPAILGDWNLYEQLSDGSLKLRRGAA